MLHRSWLACLLASLLACGGREAAEVRRETPPVATERTAAGPRAEEPQPPSVAPAISPESSAAPAAAAESPSPGAPVRSEPQSAIAPAAPGAVSVVAEAERAWNATRSLRADFTQRVSVPLTGADQRSRGMLFYRRPDRFLMRFSDPAGDVVVGDGEWIWTYYPSTDAKQVLRGRAGQGGAPVDFGREFLHDATARYDITLNGQEAVGGRATDALTLVPKSRSPYRQVRVWIDRASHLIRRLEITEENGSVRRLEFSDIRRNPSLPDTLFRFTPPPGAQVFTQ